MPECSVVRKTWGELSTVELYAFLKLRTDVFFLEQKVDDEELDWRDAEPTTQHLWIEDSAGPASYLRILVEAQPSHLDARHSFGRVVTRPDRRGEGLSHALITEVLRTHGHEAFVLHAQEYIAPLYAKSGFVAFGETYQEAGIPHISMYRAGVFDTPHAEP